MMVDSHYAPNQHHSSGFSPYTDNGGYASWGSLIIIRFRTSLAIAGADYCVIASDTRQSEGYSINSRYAPKTVKL